MRNRSWTARAMTPSEGVGVLLLLVVVPSVPMVNVLPANQKSNSNINVNELLVQYLCNE
jgi:hypothetical protein